MSRRQALAAFRAICADRTFTKAHWRTVRPTRMSAKVRAFGKAFGERW